MVHDVAGGEHAGHRRRRGVALGAALYLDVAAGHVELALEDIGVGLVADGDEQAVHVDLAGRVVLGAADADTGDTTLVAEDLVERAVPGDLDVAVLGLVEQLLLQDLLGAQRVAAVDQGYLRGDVGQVQRLLDRCVAAADDGDLLVAVEEPVAGRAGGHALTLELLFRFHAEVLRRRAGGDDQGIAGVTLAVALELERPLAEVDLGDIVEHDLGLEALGVGQHARHQVGALYAVVVAGPVVDVGRRHELATLFHAGDQYRAQVRARGVDRGGVTGRARAQDQQSAVLGVAHAGNLLSCQRKRIPRRCRGRRSTGADILY